MTPVQNVTNQLIMCVSQWRYAVKVEDRAKEAFFMVKINELLDQLNSLTGWGWTLLDR